jgi:hypothetical protein
VESDLDIIVVAAPGTTLFGLVDDARILVGSDARKVNGVWAA